MNKANSRDVMVWDPGVRLFHWLLVVAFATSYLSDDLHDVHTWAGYTVTTLLLFRLVWGFLGTRHARFSSFLYRPAAVLRYLKSFSSGRPVHYAGHNPAGAWMIFLMLTTLILISFSGLKALALEGEGPFAGLELNPIATAHAHGNETHGTRTPATETEPPPTADATPDGRSVETDSATAAQPEPQSAAADAFWRDIHAQLVNAMLGLIAIHLLGVIVSGRIHRENLVLAMITGQKRSSPRD